MGHYDQHPNYPHQAYIVGQKIKFGRDRNSAPNWEVEVGRGVPWFGGDYIAQAIVAPGERVTGTQENPAHLKFDIRNYTYYGLVQWTAARMYQGQTTNFRTPGGGFAPVYSIPDDDLASGMQAIDLMTAP